MPTISRFYGIKIMMFGGDHNPPHFHVEYSGEKAVFHIQPLAMTKGKLSPRTHSLIIERAAQHIDELMENRRLIEEDEGEPLLKIEPLS